MVTDPVILLLAREVVAERPVTLLVSENKSVSLSSPAYVPSVRRGLTKKIPNFFDGYLIWLLVSFSSSLGPAAVCESVC